MEHLEDKDVFLVKIPNKLKEYLRDPNRTFSLSADDQVIGFVESETSKPDAEQPQ